MLTKLREICKVAIPNELDVLCEEELPVETDTGFALACKRIAEAENFNCELVILRANVACCRVTYKGSKFYLTTSGVKMSHQCVVNYELLNGVWYATSFAQ
jgi:hypothetical protein